MAAFFVFIRQSFNRFVTPENFCFYFRQLKLGLQDMTRASLSNERARGLIPVMHQGNTVEEVKIDLSEEEFERLNGLYPPTVKSAHVGKRAEELVKYYFRTSHEDCAFTEQTDGSDLIVEWSGGSKKIEIKGTAEHDVAWAKLKVSSQRSHDLLRNGLPLYRVISVYDRNPRIFVLINGQDFKLRPEARWSVSPV